jgi:hypothetical protein
MPTSKRGFAGLGPAPDPNLIYVNGIDPDTGTFAVPPVSIDDLAKNVRSKPDVEPLAEERATRGPFAPFGKDMTRLEDVGWAIVFHEDTPQEVRAALAPLIEHRRALAGNLLKVLDYKKGEQVRNWYGRHSISIGDLDPELVPFYLLLVGPPTGIPFEFQYLLGVEYAVGRLAFDQPADYAQYVSSVIAYEKAAAVNNTKEIVYWGTRHLGDPATEMSATLLVNPLANGIEGAAGALKRPLHTEVGFGRQLYSGEDALKEKLVSTLGAKKPPAVLFTASHGMAIKAGRPNQASDQGGLLCQDWPGFGQVLPDYYFAAADVRADANVNGIIAFFFACFGAGTPDADQFLMDLSQAGRAPPLAPQPFIAALPRRLLAHPNGSALAVIGHIDRAWGYSIQAAKASGSQIATFRISLGNIISGNPVGYSVGQQFGRRYADLSAALLNATSPTAPALGRPSDRDLVAFWLERNDAQNYVVLGDPAVRIRTDALS